MYERLKELFSLIPNCKVFADIGCDHGYVSKGVLDYNKAERVIISDISAKSLKKAQDLLSDYVKEGRVESVVSDGFDNVGDCDFALIAGMGGEEMIKILSRRENLPQNLLLQPMKNAPKLREYLVKIGYKIQKDYTFREGVKYYEIILLEKGKDQLLPEEIEFGRTNVQIRPLAFVQKLKEEIFKIDGYLSREEISDSEKDRLTSRKERYLQYV